MTRAWAPPRHWPVPDKAQYKPLAWFVPYDKNARTHPPAQVTLLAALLAAHGPDQPIVVDEDRVILKGHGRLLAATEGGMTHFTFVQRLGLSDTEKEAMRFQDNQVALLSGWDKALMTEGLSSLKAAGYDMLKLGFPEAQLRMWGVTMGTSSESDPEEAPPVPSAPIVRLGDLWVLGEHRIVCGDATDAATVKLALGGKKPNLMVTDPPYGVSYDAGWRAEPTKLGAQAGKFKSTGGVRRGVIENDDRASWTEAYDHFPGDIAYVWHGALYSSVVEDSLHKSRFETRAQIVWVKLHAPISRGDYHWRHECCWYMVRRGRTGKWAGDRKQNTVWEVGNMTGYTGAGNEDMKTVHTTQKPLLCMRKPIENNSSAGDYVYEPFSGSGTTIIAAEMTGRRCLAIELDPAYVQVAIERWQKLTTRVATLDGKPFAQVATERKKNASRNSRKPVPEQGPQGASPQRPLRQGRNAGQSTARRVPPRQPSLVARDT